MKINNMSGVFFLSSHIYSLACQARDRAINASSGNLNGHSPDAAVALILSAAATESFINEIISFIEIEKKSGVRGDGFDTLVEFSEIGAELENSKASTQIKYLMGAKILSGKLFNKGKAPYQDFDKLLKLRNLIMHQKPDEFEIAGDGSYSFRWAPIIEDFKQLGHTVIGGNNMVSWLTEIETPRMANWGCASALAIIRAVLGFIPSSGSNLLSLVKDHFKNVT